MCVYVCVPVQLRLSHLTQRHGVKSCCHTSVLLGAACTACCCVICRKGKDLFSSFIHSQQSNISIWILVSTVTTRSDRHTHFERWQPTVRAETLFDSFWSEQFNHATAATEITSVPPTQTRHYCRKVAVNKTWRREQISAEVLQAPDHSRGYWQCETLAQREAQRDLRDGFLLCHACAHTANLLLLSLPGPSVQLHPYLGFLPLPHAHISGGRQWCMI